MRHQLTARIRVSVILLHPPYLNIELTLTMKFAYSERLRILLMPLTSRLTISGHRIMRTDRKEMFRWGSSDGYSDNSSSSGTSSSASDTSDEESIPCMLREFHLTCCDTTMLIKPTVNVPKHSSKCIYRPCHSVFKIPLPQKTTPKTTMELVRSTSSSWRIQAQTLIAPEGESNRTRKHTNVHDVFQSTTASQIWHISDRKIVYV